jgi:pseudouridine-5'-phosphate glycosidase
MIVFYREQNIAGKDVTPFVLERVNEITGGTSLQASILFLMLSGFIIDKMGNRQVEMCC